MFILDKLLAAMKNHLLSISCITLLSLTTISSYSQISITTGMAVSEGLNVGLRYGWGQYQLGVTVGTYPYYDVIANPSNGETVVAASFYHHFVGQSTRSSRKPWFYKTGLSYIHAEEYDVTFKKIPLNLLIGKEFQLGSRLGFQICAGIYYMLDSRYEDSSGSYEYIEDDRVQPSGELSLFYKFGSND